MSEEIENSPQPTEAEPALDQVAATVIRAKREVAKVATQQRLGQDGRRGPLRYGERVQITDTKKRMSTFVLEAGGYFQSVRGNLHHSEIVGLNEGSVIETASGHELMIMRPLLADYVLSMPRGAQVVYPKDSGNIVAMADIFPGARVLEAGVGSGALTMSLLSAIGEEGKLISIERREDFARIAAANVDAWFGRHHRAWQLHSGDFAQVVADLVEDASIDRVVLDMLAPWENVEQSARALAPGGVFCAYVATVTQMSRTVEALRGTQSFSEPLAWETMSRGWHVDGLAVRPDHRMVGHTGFLVLARRLAAGSKPLSRRQTGRGGAYDESGYWVADDVDERTSTDRKVRKVLRDCLVKQPDDATKVNVQATSTRGALTDQVAQTLGLDAVQRPAFKE